MQILPVLIATAVALSASQPSLEQETPDDGLIAVAQAIARIVNEDFYRRVPFPRFESGPIIAKNIDDALAGLNASHTERYTSDSIAYYDLLAIYGQTGDAALRNRIRNIFPQGTVRYAGIGMFTKVIRGKRFVSDIFPDGSADKVGILVGDEVLEVDGRPYEEIKSFEGRVGRLASIKLRRAPNSESFNVNASVVWIEPQLAFERAIAASVRTIDYKTYKIGYVRVWSLSSSRIQDQIVEELTSTDLKGADALVIDLRGRWGGFMGALHWLLGSCAPDVRFTDRNGGAIGYRAGGLKKPIVGIIDDGSRSALEGAAFILKEGRHTLVGSRTAGALLGGAAYLLPDNSLLLLAISDVTMDGMRVEGLGVAPDLSVDFQLPYAAGSDPQLQAAITVAQRKLDLIGNDGMHRCDEATVP